MEDKRLVKYIYENAKMGEQTTDTLLKTINNKDNKIKEPVYDIYNSYKEFREKSEVLLNKYNTDGVDPTIMATVGSEIGIRFKMIKDNSDPAVAEMLIKGLTMGEIEMTKKLESLSLDDEEVANLAKEFKNFQSNAIVKLKKYL